MPKNREPETPGSKIFSGLTRQELDVLIPKIEAGRAAADLVHGRDIYGFTGEMFDAKHDLHVVWMNQD